MERVEHVSFIPRVLVHNPRYRHDPSHLSRGIHLTYKAIQSHSARLCIYMHSATHSDTSVYGFGMHCVIMTTQSLVWSVNTLHFVKRLYSITSRIIAQIANPDRTRIGYANGDFQ